MQPMVRIYRVSQHLLSFTEGNHFLPLLVLNLVEVDGIEPPTFCLQSRRSPN